MPTMQTEILDIERGMWEAGDSGVYRDSLDDQAVIVMEPAGFLTKNNAIDMADKGQTGFTDIKLQDAKTIEITPDCVAIAYHGEGTNKQGKRQRSSVASTYVRREGGWKLAMTSHQPWPE